MQKFISNKMIQILKNELKRKHFLAVAKELKGRNFCAMDIPEIFL